MLPGRKLSWLVLAVEGLALVFHIVQWPVAKDPAAVRAHQMVL